jgi:energy-coupling factor transporter ATP-binding protein EcfA2
MTNLFNDPKGIISFDQCIAWMNEKGRELFGDHFAIQEDDHEIIFKLLVYFFQDKKNAEDLNLSLKKGILLSGPVGCGKTSLMKLFRMFSPQEYRYGIKPCRDISFEFMQEGYPVILKYSSLAFVHDKPRTHCFDDLGTESSLKYFGNDCNVMAEILLSRYDLFMHRRMITHITTNLTSNEIEAMYGTRVRSRMREMFNLVTFHTATRDKRA